MLFRSAEVQIHLARFLTWCQSLFFGFASDHASVGLLAATTAGVPMNVRQLQWKTDKSD